MTASRSLTLGLAVVAALGTVAVSSEAESLKIVDQAGKTRFLGNVQSQNADIQMIITDKSGKGLNNVKVQLLEQKTNKPLYTATSKPDTAAAGSFPKEARAALGSTAPVDGLATFPSVQPTTYAAVVSDPAANIATINVLETAPAAVGAQTPAGAASFGTPAIIGGTVVGGGIIAGTAIAINETNDDDNAGSPVPTPTPTPPIDPEPTPTPTPTPQRPRPSPR